MAPKAQLYAYKVFGCDGRHQPRRRGASTGRLDPNGDGDTVRPRRRGQHVAGLRLRLAEDGDSVAPNAASALGITVVVASGNGGDLYDIGGSPGDAARAITVASSRRRLHRRSTRCTSRSGGDRRHATRHERSVAYDWTNKPDLTGTWSSSSTDPSNLDGCDAAHPADTAAVAGKIAFVEWTDDDTVRRCGSVARVAATSSPPARSASSSATTRRPSPQASPAARSSRACWWPSPAATRSAPQLVASHRCPSPARRTNGFTQIDPEPERHAATLLLAWHPRRGRRQAGRHRRRRTASSRPAWAPATRA